MVDWWNFHWDCWIAEVSVEVFRVPCRRGVVLRPLRVLKDEADADDEDDDDEMMLTQGHPRGIRTS